MLSRRPGPKRLWTSIAHPMMLRLRLFNSPPSSIVSFLSALTSLRRCKDLLPFPSLFLRVLRASPYLRVEVVTPSPGARHPPGGPRLLPPAPAAPRVRRGPARG